MNKNYLKSFFIVIAIIVAISACNQTIKTDKDKLISTTESGKIEAYYFHFERRCATCNAVEKISNEAISGLNDSTITFLSVNLDEEAGEVIGNRLGINAQSLVIIKDSTLIDLTNDAFLLAGSKPEKLKEVILAEIEKLKNQ